MNVGSGPVDCANHYNDYLETQAKDTCHVCLSTGAVVGLSFHAQMGFISLVSLLILLGIIAVNFQRKRIRHGGQLKLFRRNIDILMLNLIVADIVMSLGAIPDVYWAHHRQVFCGSFCNAQGALQTVGEPAAALSTLAVTVYTFVAINRTHHTFRPRACLVVVAAIWLWALLWALVPLRVIRDPGLDGAGNVQNFYTPTPWWCWINGKYMPERIVAEYLWLWIAGVGSIALYVPSYFMVRKKQKTGRTEVRAESREEHEQPEPDTQSVASSINENDEARKLLWYPFVYTLCVLPLSIIRWAGFVNPELLMSSHIEAPSMVFISIFNLMGLFNVALILLTRPAVLQMEEDEGVGDSRAVSSNNVGVNMAQVESRDSQNVSHRSRGKHERIQTNVTLTDQQPVNAFGGPKTSLTREF
ncbi:hypothetical protein FRC10_004372 [Ceratobasidium sp. 414]|nr:hypothetical protein FRC10_004372 [Ceratobasidium sp. 414]